jgi:hypothetical protein
MSECGERAVLIITGDVEGTSTQVARRRVELRCGLPRGHAGVHRDADNAAESWESASGHVATLLRDESDG